MDSHSPSVIQYVQTLLHKTLAIQQRTLITGGHALINPQGAMELNSGTIRSFQIAAETVDALRPTYAVELGLLLNDIGMNCTEDACSIAPPRYDREQFTLPPEYTSILNALKRSKDDVHLYWEKHLRNRAGFELRRKQLQYDRDDIFQDSVGYWLKKADTPEKILLSRAKPHTPYGLPACPMITAAYFLYLQKQSYTHSVHIWYIANDNTMNVPNHFLIEKGLYVAKQFGLTMHTTNVYLTERSLTMSS